MARQPGSRRPAGFTLIELLVVMSLLGLLVTLAAPAYSTLMESQRIHREVTRLQLAFYQARSEAVKRSRRVVLCPAPADLAAPSCAGVLEDGWMLFVDDNYSRQLDAGERLLRRYEAPAGVTITNRRGTRRADESISFRPDGSARRALTFLVCSRARPDLAPRALVVNRIGRPRVARDEGTCPSPGG
jgi:type IV fimbrial biogenesis protein FimT